MILAAGRGERMRPLTDHTPKPLLAAGGRPLLEWHLRSLAEAGFRDVVINHAHLGQQIEQWVGDGTAWGLRVRFSPENPALETAGGIRRALPWLGDDIFLVVNGDVFTDWPRARAWSIASQMRAAQLRAWCVLVDNPEHHPEGDFGLQGGRMYAGDLDRLTFSGIGLYHPDMFAHLSDGVATRLAPLLREEIAAERAGAEYWPGKWTDVGTPARLAQLDAELHQVKPF